MPDRFDGNAFYWDVGHDFVGLVHGYVVFLGVTQFMQSTTVALGDNLTVMMRVELKAVL